MTLWLIGTLALAGGDPCADAKKVDAAKAELKALFDADQADHEANVEKLEKLDAKRAKSAEKLAPYACEGQTRYWAGVLLYRSRDPGVLEQAYELGKAAMAEHLNEGPWLTAVSFDKWQISRGLEQRFATQMTTVAGRGACLYPVAADSTDQERATYGLPPLKDAFRRVLDANGYDKEPATAQAVEAKKLWCDPDQW